MDTNIKKNLYPNDCDVQDSNAAWKHLYNALLKLSGSTVSRENDAMIVETSLELANDSFLLGKGFGDLIIFLNNALEAASRIGDRRSHAMINLHLGRLFYFGEQRQKAMEVFVLGKSEVEALGDEDILTQASEFIGLYYFIQGKFNEAMKYFERATNSFEYERQVRAMNPSGPMWLGYCAAFLGHYHRAIGTLDYYRRHALERGDRSLASTFRAVLGITLLGLNKNREAGFHLSGALRDAVENSNALATYFAKGGLAYHHFKEGRITDSSKWLAETMREGHASGLIRQYASPFILEMLFEYHRNEFKPIAELNYHREVSRILLEPNIHLRGVALRLRAMETIQDDQSAESDLEQSEIYLKQSGDPLQLAETHVQMARMKLRQGDTEAARLLVQKVWKGVSGYGNAFFPDDLRHLLALKDDILNTRDMPDELFQMFTDMIEALVPSEDANELLTRVVKATNRFFGAERGGIFWFERSGLHASPKLRAACNLLDTDISADIFKSCLALVFKAFRENRPQVIRPDHNDLMPDRIKSVMCVPIEIEGRVRGVFYYDNSYLEDCFDNFDESQLLRMSGALTQFVRRILGFGRQMEQKVMGHLSQHDRSDKPEILTKSAVMQKILNQAEQIAETNSTVLILGETGVGKELLARHIHNASPRRHKPLIIVDPTTITETLVESELFGHEKGAFTGADRQKHGRMELADKGTLFIDEVGEIPLSIQVKLLRVLQEKTLIRVGGVKTISSDFRLITATNRNLEEEVAKGRFREDLYYRLNVIPMTLPPLRDRKEDVLYLARHFLSHYAARHSRQMPEITKEHEAVLSAYHWPGNVREMANVMERAILLSIDAQLELNLSAERKSLSDHPFADLPSLDEVQRRYIKFILEKTNGKISGPDGAAQILEMKRTSLYNRMKKLGVR